MDKRIVAVVGAVEDLAGPDGPSLAVRLDPRHQPVRQRGVRPPLQLLVAQVLEHRPRPPFGVGGRSASAHRDIAFSSLLIS